MSSQTTHQTAQPSTALAALQLRSPPPDQTRVDFYQAHHANVVNMTPWLAARDADPALRDLEATRKVRESVAQSRATVAQFERQFARQGEKWVALRLPVVPSQAQIALYSGHKAQAVKMTGWLALADADPGRHDDKYVHRVRKALKFSEEVVGVFERRWKSVGGRWELRVPVKQEEVDHDRFLVGVVLGVISGGLLGLWLAFVWGR